MTKNIMIVGVGGQGTLLASRILGNTVINEGYDVKVSEVHGMSQRGGSVVTYVKYGEKIYSPIVDRGEAGSFYSVALTVQEVLHFPAIGSHEEQIQIRHGFHDGHSRLGIRRQEHHFDPVGVFLDFLDLRAEIGGSLFVFHGPGGCADRAGSLLAHLYQRRDT